MSTQQEEGVEAPVTKKQKRSTIDEALIAANLEEYVSEKKSEEENYKGSSNLSQTSLYNTPNSLNLNIYNNNMYCGINVNQNNLQNPLFQQNQGQLQTGANLYNIFQQSNLQQVNASTINQIQHHQMLQQQLMMFQNKQIQQIPYLQQQQQFQQQQLQQQHLQQLLYANSTPGQQNFFKTSYQKYRDKKPVSNIYAQKQGHSLSGVNAPSVNSSLQTSASGKISEELLLEQGLSNESENKGDKQDGAKKSRWGKKSAQAQQSSSDAGAGGTESTGGSSFPNRFALGNTAKGKKQTAYAYNKSNQKDLSSMVSSLVGNLSQDTAAAKGESEWSKNKGLIDYFARSFGKCNTKEEESLMESFLKNIVNNAKNNNELGSKDWSSFPLPTLPREKMSQMGSNPKIDMSIMAHIKNMKKGEMELEGGFGNSSEGGRKNLSLNSSKPSEWFNVESGTNMSFKEHSASEQKNEILAKINKNLAKKPLMLKKKGQLIVPAGAEGEKGKTPNASKLLQQIQKSKAQNNFSTEEEKRRDERRKRFHSEIEGKREMPVVKREAVQFSGVPDGEDFDFEKMAEKWKIKGTSNRLEKQYLRLTAAPDPSTVRPEKVLKEALKMLLKKWRDGSAEYPYISEQFRSLRQDIMIQHIRNKFTVKAYEHNARISLECRDLAQFKQCQTRLSELYKEGHKGHRYEFVSYRLIYLVLNDLIFELNKLLSELSDEDMDHKDVKIALELRNTYQIGNVYRLFQIYKSAPNMSQFLMDIYIDRLRVWGLRLLTFSLGEKCDLDFLTELFAFNDKDHCISFLEESGGVLNPEKTFLMNKESYRVYANHHLLGAKKYKNPSN